MGRYMIRGLGLAAALMGWVGTTSVDASALPPEWLEGVRSEAARLGIRTATLNAALSRMEFLDRVIELDRRQPEFTQTFWRYLDGHINAEQVARGRSLLARHGKLLDRVFRAHGVQPRFLVAFWALETNFGDFTGKVPLLGSLATLSFDDRRSSFFRHQLMAALQLVDSGDIPLDATGSWAGAVGQTQFMPITYRDFAEDFDGDGRRDLWRSLPDIFASSARYLSGSGWRPGETWGREVHLPANFDFAEAGLETERPLREWAGLGVRRADGAPLPDSDVRGSIILPGGHRNPAFLVYGNFKAILIWNRSLLYAVAVGHLADRLVSDGVRLLKPRPVPEDPLSRSQVIEMQQLLSRQGFLATEPDGLVGPATRNAVKAFQKRENLPADSHPTPELLERLRAALP